MSKSSDKLFILGEVAKTFAPHIKEFSKVSVKLTWEEAPSTTILIPNVEVLLEK